MSRRISPRIHLGRSSKLTHPSGTVVETPLLVPSFSGKGFEMQKNGKSMIAKVIAATSTMLTDAMLVSAYDLHYRHIEHPSRLGSIPGITFVDSGGYEISDDQDLSSVRIHNPVKHAWTEELLRSVLKSWPKRLAAVFVSYDNPNEKRPSISEQLSRSLDLFSEHRDHLTTFLVKPEKKGHKLTKNIPQLLSEADVLSSYSVIGLTEKELGGNTLERMVNIAKIRLGLDEARVTTPLHIFGALDPLSACLYFLSGAEIFDGLTWLRYAYDDSGSCVYKRNFGVVDIGVNASDLQVEERVIGHNILYLQRLQRGMRDFLVDSDFRKLGPKHGVIRDALDSLRAELGGRL